MAFTKQELQKISEELPRGYSKILAQQFGLKSGYIRNILSGSANNDMVVLAAFDLAKSYQQKMETTKTELSQSL